VVVNLIVLGCIVGLPGTPSEDDEDRADRAAIEAKPVDAAKPPPSRPVLPELPLANDASVSETRPAPGAGEPASDAGGVSPLAAEPAPSVRDASHKAKKVPVKPRPRAQRPLLPHVQLAAQPPRP
jgi:hypothetical protein